MGKKLQGAALRAKKRAQQAVEALQERQAELASTQQVQAKADADLFVLDYKEAKKTAAVYKNAIATGDIRKQKPKRVKNTLSEKDQREVDRLRNHHDAATLEKLAQRGRQLLERSSSRRKRLQANSTRANFDLWGDNDGDVQGKEEEPSRKKHKHDQEKSAKLSLSSLPAGIAPAHVPVKAKPVDSITTNTTSTVKEVVKVDVAQTAGQSYHPDPVAHTKVIQAAVEVELLRNAAIKEKETPLANRGMKEETRRILLGDSDSEDSDSDSNNDDNDDDDDEGGLFGKAVGPIPKRADKTTRAQRNKQKRLRQEQLEIDKRKQEKRFLNTVAEIPRYAKEIKRTTTELQERKERISKLKSDSKRIPGKHVELHVAASVDPIKAPILPVALSCELKSSLRSLKPKGSLVKDRMHSLVDRNLAVQRDAQAPKPKRRKLKVQGGIKGPGFEIKG